MGEKIMSKDDWRNVMVLIHEGIERCANELKEFDCPVPELIEDESDRIYVLDRIADIRSGKRAIRWITKRVVNG